MNRIPIKKAKFTSVIKSIVKLKGGIVEIECKDSYEAIGLVSALHRHRKSKEWDFIRMVTKHKTKVYVDMIIKERDEDED